MIENEMTASEIVEKVVSSGLTVRALEANTTTTHGGTDVTVENRVYVGGDWYRRSTGQGGETSEQLHLRGKEYVRDASGNWVYDPIPDVATAGVIRPSGGAGFGKPVPAYAMDFASLGEMERLADEDVGGRMALHLRSVYSTGLEHAGRRDIPQFANLPTAFTTSVDLWVDAESFHLLRRVISSSLARGDNVTVNSRSETVYSVRDDLQLPEPLPK